MVLFADVKKCVCGHVIIHINRERPGGESGWLHLHEDGPATVYCTREPGPKATPEV